MRQQTTAEVARYGDLSAPRFADFYGIGNDRIKEFVAAKRTEKRDLCTTFRSIYFAGLDDSEATDLHRLDALICQER